MCLVVKTKLSLNFAILTKIEWKGKSYFNFFLVFLGPHLGHMEVPRSNGSRSCWPTPQSQQCRIRAGSSTYTTAWGNAGSLTHWARPAIKPTFSRILVRFLTCWATTGAPWLSPHKWNPLCKIQEIFMTTLLRTRVKGYSQAQSPTVCFNNIFVLIIIVLFFRVGKYILYSIRNNSF